VEKQGVDQHAQIVS